MEPTSIGHISRSAFQERLIIAYPSMQFNVQLLWDKAPDMCHLIAELASGALGDTCEFYRNEAAPEVCWLLALGADRVLSPLSWRLQSLAWVAITTRGQRSRPLGPHRPLFTFHGHQCVDTTGFLRTYTSESCRRLYDRPRCM